MFSIFAAQRRRNITIYAFEPIPPVFKSLQLNAALHGLAGKVYECGLAETSKQELFTFYPHNTVISSSSTNQEEAHEIVKSYLLNQQQGGNETGDGAFVDELLEERLRSETYTCQLRTISEIIEADGVEKIDLLKIDVEKGEHDVLRGIRECDWPRIRQLVMEVHDVPGRIAEIVSLLKSRGYVVNYEKGPSLQSTALYNLYAFRPVVEDSLVDGNEVVTQAAVENVWKNHESLVHDVRSFLSKTLPEYMVPAVFVPLCEIPLTANGKLDRKALPAPEMDFYAAHGDDPPQGDVETMLAAIWAETLRLKHVNRHDDFFRLGGHSLLTLRVVRLLQERGFIITLADIFANPTIRSLAAKLKTRERPDSADIAIQINDGGADRPLFLTHCGNGELLYAAALSPHIDRNIPLYGLPAKPADQVQLETIEEMAIRMVHMIRSAQPTGPYRIAGWSVGGTIAYEIAAQLIAAQEQVEFLAMFDTYCPRSSAMAGFASVDFNDKVFLLNLIASAGTEGGAQKAALDSIRMSLPTMDFADVVQECDRLLLIPDTLKYLTAAQIRLKLARTYSLVAAGARYQPRPLHIPVHLFSALDSQDSGDSSPHRGWNHVVPGDLLRLTQVSGSHHSMLRSPNVEQLGRILAQTISQIKH